MRTLPFILFFFAALFAGNTQAQTTYGLSGSSLITFDASAPGIVMASSTITGIAAGQTIEGLDCRPATGELYALGYNKTTGEARLYVIDPATATATAMGMANVNLGANVGNIGFDFNPTVDRIRVISGSNANFRLHPVTGAIVAVDGTLAFAAGDANEGVNPAIGSCAYTNSYIGATSTTLFTYDDSLNILCSQIPPNNGTQNTIGNSGIFLNLTDPTLDIDIFFDTESSANVALLVANTDIALTDMLFSLNLSNGLCTPVGPVGLGVALSDIAVAIDRTVPATVSGRLMYALAANNNLLTFDSDDTELIRTAVAVSGVAMGQVLVGLDVRPATGELYALGYNSTTGEAMLYVVNPTTAMFTPIGAAPIMLGANLGKIGFDFNPTVDRIRVVSSTNANFRLHPETGVLVATDGMLAFAAGDPNAGTDPSIGSCAYTNSFNGTTTTTLFTYDDSLNVFCTQVPPNNGTQNTVGLSGLMLNPGDASGDLDIYFDFETNTNIAYQSLNGVGSAFDQLFTVNLATGSASLVGKIGFGIAVNDIAVALDSVVTVGIQEVVAQNANQLEVYPNPVIATANVAFELPQQADVRVVLTDISGRQVAVVSDVKTSAGRQNISLDAALLPPGLYFVQLYLDGSLHGVKKMVKQ